MKYNVDGWNNFCRVFEVPSEFPKGFCFGGGKPTSFKMVDWFNPVSGVNMAACTKEIWKDKVGKIEVKEVLLCELVSKIGPFIKEKLYRSSNKDYLVICDFGACFMINKDS